MHDAGAPSVNILQPVEIDVPWDELDSSASGLKSASSDAASAMTGIGSSWGGLVQAYRQPESEQAVWSAMDDVPSVVEDWADAMDSAVGVLRDFVDEGRPLQIRSEALKQQAAGLQLRLAVSNLLGPLPVGEESGEDSALRQAIAEHNAEVLNLNQEWNSLESRIAGDLSALEARNGQNDQVPQVYVPGTGNPMMPAGMFSPSFDLASIVSASVGESGENEDRGDVRRAKELYEATTRHGAGAEETEAFYEHLATLSPEEIEEFSSIRTRIHNESPILPETQEDLDNWPDGAAWWNGMEDDQQDAMVEHLPLLTGNTGGVPYEARNEANEAALAYLLASSTMTNGQKEKLREIRDSTEGSNRMLLSLNTGDTWHSNNSPDPLAAVSVGNPDEAETTSFNVPGMGSGTHNMTTEVERADGLHEELGNTHAVVSWVGYDAPEAPETSSYPGDWVEVLSNEKAEQGGWALAHSINGYHQTMEGQDRESILRINAHSYGTNTAAYALTRTDQPVDSYTMFGSAGIPEDVASNASDLNVKETEEGNPAVYATESKEDQWAGIGRWGAANRIDPTDSEFGAYVFSSDGYGNVPGEPVTDHRQNFFGEGGPDDYGYLDENSQSANSILKIMEGEAHTIEFDPEEPPPILDRPDVGL